MHEEKIFLPLPGTKEWDARAAKINTGIETGKQWIKKRNLGIKKTINAFVRILKNAL